MTPDKKKELVHRGIRAGKTTKAVMEFYARGLKGEKAIIHTPIGDFMSPAAAEAYAKEIGDQRFREGQESVIKPMKKWLFDNHDHGHDEMDDNTPWVNSLVAEKVLESLLKP